MAYGPKLHLSRNCQKYDKFRTSQKQPIEKNNFGFHLPYSTYHHTAWDRMLVSPFRRTESKPSQATQLFNSTARLTFAFYEEQEKQRAHMRTEADHVDGSALFNRTADVARRNVPRCGHCHRIGHTEDRCWDLYPERRPAHYSGTPNRGTNGKSLKGTSNAAYKSGTALVANDSGTAQPSDMPEDGTDFVCLMAKAKVSPSISRSDQSVSCTSSLTWHIDSGASAHMTFDRSAFSSYTKVDPFSVELGDKSTSIEAGRGDVGINVKVNGGQRLCMLQDVLHIPDFAYSLVSVSALVERDITVSFDKIGVSISRNTCLLVSGSKAGKLFVLDAVRPPAERSLVANLDLWHQRLEHVQRARILEMALFVGGKSMADS